MMRILTFSILLFLTSMNISAQDLIKNKCEYHLIYIELSANNNRKGLSDRLNSLIKGYSEQGDSIVSYLSNAENGRFYIGTLRIEELFSLIGDINIALPDVELDLRKITNYWNEHDITFLDKNGITHLKYQGLKIHYFISPSFYELADEHFASKLLAVNNINEYNKNTDEVQQLFYFNREDIKDDYLEYIQKQHELGLETSIERKFLTY